VHIRRLRQALEPTEHDSLVRRSAVRLSLPARLRVTPAKTRSEPQARAGRSSLAELRSSSLTPSARHSSVSFSSAPSVMGCSSSQTRCSVSWKPLFEALQREWQREIAPAEIERAASLSAKMSAQSALCSADLRFGELAAVREDQPRQARLLLLGKAGHVGLRQDVGRVLVITGVSDRDADLVQARRQRSIAVSASEDSPFKLAWMFCASFATRSACAASTW